MGSEPAMADQTPVTAMSDFLEEVLEEAVEIRGRIDEGIRRLRERIHALRLAEDEQFVTEHLAFSRSYDPASEPGLTPAEFADLYLTAK